MMKIKQYSIGLLISVMVFSLPACDSHTNSKTLVNEQKDNSIDVSATEDVPAIDRTFANEEYVDYSQLLTEIEKIAVQLESSEIMRSEFDALRASHNIANTQAMFKDFIRVRLAFEATRDGGLWQLHWSVTNQEPNSNQIWKQWKHQKAPEYQSIQTSNITATAECDELSALFAVIARGLGVKEVGLFWPTYNHTVAVWKATGKHKEEVRVVVPTSQVFLSRKASLGTKEFNPSQQKTIYNYTQNDVSADDKIPTPLAEMMISQLKRYASSSAIELQTRRNLMSKHHRGS